jgi:hypothetical protein
MKILNEHFAQTDNKTNLEDKFVETPFNAGPFIRSLRKNGYDVYSATADLVDNCIDAGASKVWIDIIPSSIKKPDGAIKKVIDKDSIYYIADNGCGMDEDTLLQAMAIGSDTDHDPKIDLGKYGVGLKQACLGLAKVFTVLTKQPNGPIISSTFSCDEIISKGKLGVSRPSLATELEQEFFNNKVKNSDCGTVVIMQNLDQFGVTCPKSFKSTLKGGNQLGRIFRFMLESKLEIHVGQKHSRVESADPTKWSDKKTTRYTDGWQKLEVANGRKKGNISYRICKHASDPSRKEGHRPQGVIWIRNLREIKSGLEKSLWSPSNETYGLWVEIKFSGDLLDDVINLTTRKDNVKPGQDLMDKLSAELLPQIKAIRDKERSNLKNLSKASNNINAKLKDFCDEVKKIENLLTLPPIEPSTVSFNKSKNNSNRGASAKNSNNNPVVPSVDLNGELTFKAKGKRKFEFELCPYRRYGILYHAEQDGSVLKVIANEDHDFISKNLIGATEESTQGAVKRLLFAMALAELQVPEIYKDAFNDFKEKFNINLRNLTNEI